MKKILTIIITLLTLILLSCNNNSSGGGSGGGNGRNNECFVDKLISIGKTCKVKITSTREEIFTVLSSGCAKYANSKPICEPNFSFNDLEAIRNTDGSFIITAVPEAGSGRSK